MSDEKSTNDTTEEAPEPKPKPKRKSKLEKLAEEVLDTGVWGTGRDRDELLRASGHDPDEVRAAVVKLRGERIKAESERRRWPGSSR